MKKGKREYRVSGKAKAIFLTYEDALYAANGDDYKIREAINVTGYKSKETEETATVEEVAESNETISDEETEADM